MMLRDFLHYTGVFKKSVRGKMCLFYRYLKLCPRENFLKMLPEEAILWVRINSRFGSSIKILKLSLHCWSLGQQLCPRAYLTKMTP